MAAGIAIGMGLALSTFKWRSMTMMRQFETGTQSKHSRVDYRNSPGSKYEVRYLMRLGSLSHSEAADLISRHDGDRCAINAELIARRRSAQSLLLPLSPM